MNDNEVSVNLLPDSMNSKPFLGESLDGDDGREAVFERVSEGDETLSLGSLVFLLSW